MEPGLTVPQWEAVESIQRAMKKAKKAGLKIVGMDQSLLAFNGEELAEAERQHPNDITDAMRSIGQGIEIEDHGVWHGGGGW